MIGILKIGPIMALSVSDRYRQFFYYYRFPVPISINVGVSHKSAKIAQKMLVKQWN